MSALRRNQESLTAPFDPKTLKETYERVHNWVRAGYHQLVTSAACYDTEELQAAGVSGSDLLEVFHYSRNGSLRNPDPRRSGEKIAEILRIARAGWKLPRDKVRHLVLPNKIHDRSEKEKFEFHLQTVSYHFYFPKVITQEDLMADHRLLLSVDQARKNLLVWGESRSKRMCKMADTIPVLVMRKIHQS